MKKNNNTSRGNVAFIGLGDMGGSMAKNLVRAGFNVAGYDLSPKRRHQLKASGGRVAKNAADAATDADVAFVMVMNGAQVMEVVAGKHGLVQSLPAGAVIVITGTIEQDELHAAAEVAAKHGFDVVDAPVSGGMPGARDAKLIFMAAGTKRALKKVRPHMMVTGKTIHIVGNRPGEGQIVKASLQAMLGGLFAGIFEAMALGTKAGIDGKILYNVFTTSGAASPLVENCVRLIVQRKFKGTGSRITTMHKDLGITTNLGRKMGVPMITTAVAHQLFQAGISTFPDEDNWCVFKVLENLSGVQQKSTQKKRSKK